MDDDKRLNLIRTVVALVRQKDGGQTSCAPSIWEEACTGVVTGFLLGRSPDELTTETMDRMVDIVLESVRSIVSSARLVSTAPAVCSVSASAIEKKSNASNKRKYEGTTLEHDVKYGAFVSVKSYTQFCLNMTENFQLQEETKKIISEPVERLFPREAARTSERPRSALLSALLQEELAKLQVKVRCVHQCPIVPLGKEHEQLVDVACIVRVDGISVVAATIEYKSAEELDSFRTQASIYATDAMNSSNLPCLAVQIGGTSLDSLAIRVYGVVVNYLPGSTHALSLLHDGRGMPGLCLFLSGLKAYLEYFPNERPGQWNQGLLSHVVSMHEWPEGAYVFKAYDYRVRKFLLSQDRRNPNIDLVRTFVDRNAKLTSVGNDFQIVTTKFLKRDDGKPWYGPISSRKLAQILLQLKDLHRKNFVHGDVRLRNMILHEGILTDFDFSRIQGSFYPSTLLELTGDGIRHPEVAAAIQQQGLFEETYQRNEQLFRRDRMGTPIEWLRMEFAHDVFAMKHVLNLFRPMEDRLESEWRKIVELEDLWSMIDPLNAFPCEVEPSIELNDGQVPNGTGSPKIFGRQ